VWAVVKVNGQWYTSGFIQMWRQRASTGAPLTEIVPGTGSSQFAVNWAYDGRWGPMAGHQAVAGEQMGFFVSAGNARGVGTVTSVRERSNVVLINLPVNDTGTFTFASTRVPTDFNGDRKPDLVIRNYVTGANQILYMDGATQTGTASLPGVSDLNWQLVAVGDFNGDGHPDLVWHNAATGENALWYLTGANGSTFAGRVTLPPVYDLSWQIVGAGDLDNDGWPDLIWRNTVTGANVVWFMRAGAFVSLAALPSVTPDWQMVAAADFNQDGSTDLLWRNLNTGANVAWLMNGIQQVGAVALTPLADATWQIVNAVDVNADGFPDLVWHNNATGQNAVWLLSGVTTVSNVAMPATPLDWRPVQALIRPAPRDLNGDNHPDVVWRNQSTGANAVWFMNGSTELAAGTLPSLGANWQLAVVTDVNGDGYPDFVWRNTSTGQNSISYMRGTSGVLTVALAPVSDLTFEVVGAADLLRSGTPQLIWRNRVTGVNLLWSIQGGAFAGSTMLQAVDTTWHLGAVADMNGDGYPDLIWRNATTGANLVWLMSGATHVANFTLPAVAPGWDLAQANDMNGDGWADLVWRNGTTGENVVWYMQGLSLAGKAMLPSLTDMNWTIVK
jgi:hypothetical protein